MKNNNGSVILSPGSLDDSKPLHVVVDRPAVTQNDFNKSYDYIMEKRPGVADDVTSCLSYEFSPARILRGLRARLPVVDVIRSYNFKEFFLGDLVAGITVGVMQIPLGMAYATLNAVDPIYGLYSSFFPVLFYFFFGTSKHTSQGTFAVISLMSSAAVKQLSCPSTSAGGLGPNMTSVDSGGGDAHPQCFPAEQVASAIALLVGIFQVIMGFARIGALSVYLSDTLVSGFTTGAACLVFSSQFGNLFGIAVDPTIQAPGELVKTFQDVFIKMGHNKINWAAVIVSVICIVVLAVTSEYINPVVSKKIRVPIPIELIAVVVGTGVSYAMGFHENYNIPIVGNIPRGMPTPVAPPVFSVFGGIVSSAISVAIVSYVIQLSLAKIFAKKYSYDINANQEFIALGVSNFASSFFHCFPMSVALSRTMVNDQVGGKTHVSSLLSSLVVLFVILVIAPLFGTLPKCVLAAIIVVAIRKMFLQYRDMLKAWQVSRFEAMTWIVTTLAVSLVAIDYGLAIGVIFSILTIVWRTQCPYVTLLGQVENTCIYKDIKKYNVAAEIPGIKLYHFGAPLVFANNKTFRKEMYRLVGVNPRKIYKKMMKLKNREAKEKSKNDCSISLSSVLSLGESDKTSEGIMNPAFRASAFSLSGPTPLPLYSVHSLSKNPLVDIYHIIIDLSAVSFIDSMGVTTLTQVIDEYKKIDISVTIAACPDPVIETLYTSGFLDKQPVETLYPSIHDAVLYATRGHIIEDIVTSDMIDHHPSRQ